MTFENLLVEDRGAVRIITINRPKALNALNRATLVELNRALDDLAGVRALILTGAGEKSFVAGADIGEMKDMSPVAAQAFAQYGHETLDRFGKLAVPVIAAVNGYALGGGLELALACDFIYASENAKLGLVEVNLGIIPGFGGCARLARRVGTAMASEMIFSAAQLTADEALRVGLVNRVVPQVELITTAQKTAETIASKGPVAVSLAKRMLVEGADADARVAHAMEQVSFGVVFSTADKTEGVSAFLEKRKAEFKGA